MLLLQEIPEYIAITWINEDSTTVPIWFSPFNATSKTNLPSLRHEITFTINLFLCIISMTKRWESLSQLWANLWIHPCDITMCVERTIKRWTRVIPHFFCTWSTYMLFVGLSPLASCFSPKRSVHRQTEAPGSGGKRRFCCKTLSWMGLCLIDVVFWIVVKSCMLGYVTNGSPVVPGQCREFHCLKSYSFFPQSSWLKMMKV